MISFEHRCRDVGGVGSKYFVIDFMVSEHFPNFSKMRRIFAELDFPGMFLKSLHPLHPLHQDYIKNERILFLYIV
jgi:hypothetical protein